MGHRAADPAYTSSIFVHGPLHSRFLYFLFSFSVFFFLLLISFCLCLAGGGGGGGGRGVSGGDRVFMSFDSVVESRHRLKRRSFPVFFYFSLSSWMILLSLGICCLFLDGLSQFEIQYEILA